MNDLVVDQARIDREKDFHNKRFAQDIQEEPRLKYYNAIINCRRDHLAAVAEAAAGRDVLEYGCAEGEFSVEFADIARSVHGIDISEVAIEKARERARAAGVENAVFSVADAMETGLPEESFDVVFGSGIIHHLDTECAYREIHRILRPGGVALFKEPLKGNFVLELYRKMTPDSRTLDEHPLTARDFALADDIFSRTEFRHYGLLTIGVVPFRGKPIEKPLFNVLAAIDSAILKVPGLKWQAWYAFMKMVK